MKNFDFKRKSLEKIPLLNEIDDIELRLEDNSISLLDSVPETCKRLYLANNKISHISRNHAQHKLNLLDMSFNRVIALSGIENFSYLSELNLSNNYISDEQLVYLKALKELVSINLSNNNLKSSNICNVIGDLSSLENLNLSNNSLESLEFNRSCPNLVHLELDSNKLVSLSFRCKFEKLNFLSIPFNKIENLENVKYIPNIEFLIANDNAFNKTQFLEGLNFIKILNLKNNSIDKINLQNLSRLEILDLSFNNLTELQLKFSSRLKTVLAYNNKIMKLVIEAELPSIELFHCNNNLIKNYDFLKNCENVSNLNISCNSFNDFSELVSKLKSKIKLKDLNLIGNEFNKNINYHETLLRSNNFSCIFDIIKKNENDKNFKTNRTELLCYRAYLITNIETLQKIDGIPVSFKERENATKELKENQETIKNFKLFYKKEMDLDNYIKPSEDLSTIAVTCTMNTQNSSQQNTQINTQNGQISTQNKLINFKKYPELQKIYNSVKKEFFRLCDVNGYMKIKECNNLMIELLNIYELQKELKIFLDDINLINNSEYNLFPGKIHFKDFTFVLKNEKIINIYKTLNSKLTKVDKHETPIKTYRDDHNHSFNKHILIEANDEKILNKAHSELNIATPNFKTIDKPIFTSTFRTPLLKHSNTENKNSQTINTNSNIKSKIKTNDLLLQSMNNCPNIKPNLQDKNYLQNLLNYMSSPPFPIRNSDSNKRFFYDISKTDREYKFINQIVTTFRMDSFELKKFYCQDFYNLVFKNNYYNFFEFIFENNIYLFYGNFDKDVERFIKDRQIHYDVYLTLDDNLNKITSKEVVIYIMINKNNPTETSNGKLKQRLYYDDSNDKFTYTNPFDIFLTKDNITTSIEFAECKEAVMILPIYVVKFSN